MNKAQSLLFILMLSPFVAKSDDAAIRLLDEAVENIRNDAALQLSFTCTVFDAEGVVVSTNDGSLKIDDSRYVLLLDDIKIWCDGETQWNYMAQTNEIYITEAGSEEAQNFSPIYLMQLYKQGYKATLHSDEKHKIVILEAADESNGIERVEVFLDSASVRPDILVMNISGQGSVEVIINDYKPKYKLEDRVYKCPVEDFPSSEIVDMR